MSNQMTGYHAILLGARHAGCTRYAGPPGRGLEPFQAVSASSSASFDEAVPEIARASDAASAVGMCIEAAHQGERVMAVTSGADLALCGRNLTLAQLAEVPLVLVHCQYLCEGPDHAVVAGDVDVALARHLTVGSLPLPVLAPSDTNSACRLTCEAFNIAERLRTPVVMLTSPALLSVEVSIDEMLCDPPPIPAAMPPLDSDPPFERTARPRCVQFLGTVGDEHVVLNLDAATLDARLGRLRDKILNNRQMPEHTRSSPDPDAETLLLSYGLTDKSAVDALRIVRDGGSRVSHLTLHSLWPIPEQTLRRATTPFIRRVLLPELNAGLYADELRRSFKTVPVESITRCDGQPIDPTIIARRITDWPCG